MDGWTDGRTSVRVDGRTIRVGAEGQFCRFIDQSSGKLVGWFLACSFNFLDR